MPGLFNKKMLDQRIENYSIENMEEKREEIKDWQKSSRSIQELNERRLQSDFLNTVFGDILGYENKLHTDEWTMDIERSTDMSSKTPDGTLGFYHRKNDEVEEEHRAVIELKGPQVPLEKDQNREGATYKSPIDQAFSYTSELDKCKWYIVSNFTEIRLYKVGRSKEYYEVFHLDELGDENEFKKFHYLLCKNNLLSKRGKSQTLELSEAAYKQEKDISDEFYNSYKNTRIELFEHLKENNEDIDSEVLLEKAQKFLDRIIFICFCEDKGLLPNNLLYNAIERAEDWAEDSLTHTDTEVWQEIKRVFRGIDKGNSDKDINTFNGGLFGYDEVMDNLKIKNDFFEVVYDISDYDFDSDVDVNILGHIFERSIWDIGKLKADIKGNEYDKNKSRRKKEGIYYTRQYITSYIVENAVGGYLGDIKEELGYHDLPDIKEAGSESWKTQYTDQHLDFYDKYEERLKEIKILDPACGSGAFLNQAFDYLLKEHKWLNKRKDWLKSGGKDGDKGYQTRIPSSEAVQRSILTNNLYGVDVNEEPVEITKLSLWLKTANKKKPLTNLDDNIKCGDSVIDDPEVAEEGKAFKWEEEFPEIMAEGGFDVIIGNPPYVKQQKIKWMKPYLEKNYEVYSGVADLYVYFFERGIELLKPEGYFSFIVSNKFTRARYGKKLRKYLLNNQIENYVDYSSEEVFPDVSVDPCVIVVKKTNPNPEHNIAYNKNNRMPQKVLDKHGWAFTTLKEREIMEKIEDRGIPLKEWNIDAERGVTTGYNKAFVVDEEKRNELIKKNPQGAEIIKPLLRNKDISRYRYKFRNKWLIKIEGGWTNRNRGNVEPEEYFKKTYPAIHRHLKNIGDKIEQGQINTKGRGLYKRDDQGDYWWELRPCNYYQDFEQPKIVYRDISERLTFCYDDKKMYSNHDNKYVLASAFFLNCGNKYLLALLNSKAINFYHKRISTRLGSGASRGFAIFIEKLPIPKINKKRQNSFGKKASKITELYKQLSELKESTFNNYIDKYTSFDGSELVDILENKEFNNKIYSGRARKVRDFTVNINANIITLYSEKSSSGKYELLKFEENDEYRRQYIKYYLEDLTEEQLQEINNNYSGNLIKKVLQIEIPDYDKDQVVRKVVNEWEELQQETKDLEQKIEKTDNEIDQKVYELYDLTDEEIKTIEKSSKQS